MTTLVPLSNSVRERLVGQIARHPRMELGHFPTPLESMARLGNWIGGPSLFVKRDDASGMGQGGNKVRALEFVVPAALAAKADILVTAGVVQSNSVRQVAAAAAKVGLDCHFAMITDRVAETDGDYALTGNIFLDFLYGATHEPISVHEDRVAVLKGIAERLRLAGRRPFIVPYGCADRLGAIGYLNAGLEIAEQATAQRLNPTHIVLASGSGGTQAGLIVGFAALGSPIKVIGIDVDADAAGVRGRVTHLVRELADEVGLDPGPLIEGILIEPGYSAGAYGHPDAATLEAMSASARLEALIVDPVYSAKALAGLIGLSRRGQFKASDQVIFLHSGGTPAIYAYRSHFGFGG